ncbi:hypothetical protein MAUB1S_06021 [Mycolicibacterium aubagnense]
MDHAASLTELHAQKTAIEAELSEQPAEPILGLHPVALRRYEQNVADLHGVFGEGLVTRQ